MNFGPEDGESERHGRVVRTARGGSGLEGELKISTLRFEIVAFLMAAALFGTVLFKHLGYPLLWQDEAETAVFATRVLEYGYPKVHGRRNVVYEFGPNIALGVKESVDAYIGTTWGHFYFAVPGVVWAAGADDLYVRTARLRLPFALVGAAGIFVFVWIAMPVFREAPRRGVVFAALFVLLSAGSVSLVLHLREVRYYPLVVFEVGSILLLYSRRVVFGNGRDDARGGLRFGLAVAALLVLLFHTFYAAYFSVVALLGGHALLCAFRARSPGERSRFLSAGFLPALLSALLVIPSAIFFETAGIAARFAEHAGLGLNAYFANLAGVMTHFWRQEYLAPALALRIGSVAVRRARCRRGGATNGIGGTAARERPSDQLTGFLAFFAVGYVVLGCVNPLVYERYFVVLSPVVTLVFLLDAFALFARVPTILDERLRVWAQSGVALAAIGLVGFALSLRAPELRGRLTELAVPYRGPLDFAMEHIRNEYRDPAQLVIATNYAAHTYMYYLGSHVIVGLSLNNIARDRVLDPDLVIPRRRWPPGRAELRRFLQRSEFEVVALPVEDRHFNNVPAVTRTRAVPDPHRFRTPESADPSAQLMIYERGRTQGSG